MKIVEMFKSQSKEERCKSVTEIVTTLENSSNRRHVIYFSDIPMPLCQAAEPLK